MKNSKIQEKSLLLQDWIRNNPKLYPVFLKIYENLPPFITRPKIYPEIIKSLDDIEENTDQIDGIQRTLLTKILKHALLNVPYYKKRVKIDPDSINENNVFEILAKFPFLTKEIVMKHSKEFIDENVNNSKLRYQTSGGSTGRGIKIWKSWQLDYAVQAFVDHMWGKYGYNTKRRIMMINRSGIASLNEFPCKIKGNKLLVSPHHLNEKWLPKIVQKIQEFKPEYIRAFPSCLEILVGYLKEKNISLKIKGIFLSYEAVLPAHIEFFEEVFGAKVFVEYGSNENILLGHGCYDGKELHYHFNPLFGFVENYKDKNGNYELVGTGLWNYTMPLIRYRTQDFGKISKGKDNCNTCKSSWQTILHLDGREQEYLVTKHGTLYPGHAVTIDSFIWDYVSIFQFVQNKPGELELQVVPKKKLTKEAEKKILDAQKKRLSEWFNVKLVSVNQVFHTKIGKRGLVIVNHKG